MESAVLGFVLDSSSVIAAERNSQSVASFIEAIPAVTVAELVHGIYRAKTVEAAQRRREFIEELLRIIPVHPMTQQTAWLVGRIEGQEAAKGNVLPFNDLMSPLKLVEEPEPNGGEWRRLHRALQRG